MADGHGRFDPSTWDPALDAVIAAPDHHKVLFENDRLRVVEVTLEPSDEEPVRHHRWPSVFVFDSMKPPLYDFAPDGTELPPNRDVIQAVQSRTARGISSFAWRRSRRAVCSTAPIRPSTASASR
jgi:hypothetical protein